VPEQTSDNMKVSELIKALQDMQEKHGDLEIVRIGTIGLHVGHHDVDGNVYSAEDVEKLIAQAIENGDDGNKVRESYPGPFLCIGEFTD
jgi:hypothetical protein